MASSADVTTQFLVLVHRRRLDEPETHRFDGVDAAFDFYVLTQADPSAVMLEFIRADAEDQSLVQPVIGRSAEGEWVWFE